MANIPIEQYAALQAKRAAMIRAGSRRGPITAAKYMAARLRQMAPLKTGHLRGGIARRGNQVTVRASNPENGFPYIHWINATPGTGLRAIRLARRPTRYGTWPRRSTRDANPGYWTQLRTYASTNHTGEPGFYWIAQADTRRYFRSAMIEVTHSALSSTF